MANPVVHFEVLGKDPAALCDFYGKLFGWKLETPDPNDPMQYSMVSTEGGEGAIDGGIGKAMHGDGSVTFYVGVDDLQAALDQVQSLGGHTIMPPQETAPSTHIALFADPEGHVVGLVHEA